LTRYKGLKSELENVRTQSNTPLSHCLVDDVLTEMTPFFD